MKKIFYYCMLIINIIILIVYIIPKYLQEIFPKEIPFTLTVKSIIFLIFMCLLCILRIIFLKKKNGSNFLRQFIPLITLFEYFDNIIKKNSKVSYYFNEVILWFVKFQSNIFLINFLFGLELFIRTLFIIVFLIDIFYFNCLYFSYKIISIVFVTLFINYIDYSINKFFNEKLIFVDNTIYILCFSNVEKSVQTLTAKEFISIQHYRILTNKTLLIYEPSFKLHYLQEQAQKLNLISIKFLVIEKMKLNIRNFLNTLIFLYKIIFIYKKKKNNVLYENYQIFLIVLQFIAWFYILIKTINTIDTNSLLLLLKMISLIKSLEDPFSQLPLDIKMNNVFLLI